ncbi:DUF4060 family protein [Xenorhabdus indica]|uniref:DUF4060 family protein n=1 Tax=Xenorhabdus indica TaxID=333964 RepID=UPI0016574E40|nr:DUF4060 family protein [Xenorhabdus indica]MBC8944640.1 hypothetical protein [Xenorhabdus indica]
MKFIIRSAVTPLERQAAKAALSEHKNKYGNYGLYKKIETYVVLVGGSKYPIEILNGNKSYVATVVNKKRRLCQIKEV